MNHFIAFLGGAYALVIAFLVGLYLGRMFWNWLKRIPEVKPLDGSEASPRPEGACGAYEEPWNYLKPEPDHVRRKREAWTQNHVLTPSEREFAEARAVAK